LSAFAGARVLAGLHVSGRHQAEAEYVA